MFTLRNCILSETRLGERNFCSYQAKILKWSFVLIRWISIEKIFQEPYHAVKMSSVPYSRLSFERVVESTCWLQRFFNAQFLCLLFKRYFLINYMKATDKNFLIILYSFLLLFLNQKNWLRWDRIKQSKKRWYNRCHHSQFSVWGKVTRKNRELLKFVFDCFNLCNYEKSVENKNLRKMSWA